MLLGTQVAFAAHHHPVADWEDRVQQCKRQQRCETQMIIF
jgi:hypothetical protein